MAVISRLKLDHPALGATGGAALHAQIQAIYEKIGDNLADRFVVVEDFLTATSEDIEHNFNTEIDNLRFDIYEINIGTGELVQRLKKSTTPSIDDFAVVAKVGQEKNQLTITNSSGGTEDIAIIIHHDPIELTGNDMADVDNSVAIEEGQTYVYDSVAEKMKPGASGDSSFKVQSVASAGSCVIKGGYLLLDDGSELATYDGAGSASTDYGVDITAALGTLVPAPVDDTTYYLYVDKTELLAPVTLSDNARKVIGVTESQMVALTTKPDDLSPSRYIPLGFVRRATAAWSESIFGTLATRRHQLIEDKDTEINMIQSPSKAISWASTGAVTVETTTTSAELPLEGAISTAIKISAGAATQYARYRFTMADALKQTMLKIEWFQRVLSSFANDDFKVEMWTNAASDYSGAYTEVALNTDVSGDTNLKALDGVFRTSFFAANGDYYELRIVRNAGTSALAIANVIVGPGKNAQGAVITPWEVATLSATANITITSSTVYRRQNGTNLELLIRIQASASASNITLTLPTGFSFDSTIINATADSGSIVGTGRVQAGGGTQYTILPYAFSSNVVSFKSNGNAGNVGGNNPATGWATGTSFLIAHLNFPCAELAGSGVVNLGENDVEYAASTTGTWDAAAAATDTIYGPEGAPISGALTADRSKIVQFRTPIQPTDSLELQIQNNGEWVPAATRYPFSQQNTLFYGVRFNGVSGNDSQAQAFFGRYNFASGATFGAVGGAWASGERWRVVKHKAGIPVGFGAATANQAGLVPSYEHFTLSVGTSGNYTGGEIQFTKIGRLVTFSVTSTLTHASLSTATSAAGLIPERFRPQSTVMNVYNMSASILYRVIVEPNGAFTTNYRDFAGGAVSVPSSADVITMSYVAES